MTTRSYKTYLYGMNAFCVQVHSVPGIRVVYNIKVCVFMLIIEPGLFGVK